MSTAAAAAPKKVRAAKRKTTPSKDVAPKAKRGDGQRVSTPSLYRMDNLDTSCALGVRGTRSFLSAIFQEIGDLHMKKTMI